MIIGLVMAIVTHVLVVHASNPQYISVTSGSCEDVAVVSNSYASIYSDVECADAKSFVDGSTWTAGVQGLRDYDHWKSSEPRGCVYHAAGYDSLAVMLPIYEGSCTSTHQCLCKLSGVAPTPAPTTPPECDVNVCSPTGNFVAPQINGCDGVSLGDNIDAIVDFLAWQRTDPTILAAIYTELPANVADSVRCDEETCACTGTAWFNPGDARDNFYARKSVGEHGCHYRGLGIKEIYGRGYCYCDEDIDSGKDGIYGSTLADSPSFDGKETFLLDSKRRLILQDVDETDSCMQLGANGEDFSVSFWLNSTYDESNGALVLGTTTPYGHSHGWVIATSVAAARDGESMEINVASFSGDLEYDRFYNWPRVEYLANEWVLVTLNYKNDGDDSTATLSVNANFVTATTSPTASEPYTPPSDPADRNTGSRDRLALGVGPWGTHAQFMVSDMRSYTRLLSHAEIEGLYQEHAHVVTSVEALAESIDNIDRMVLGDLSLTEEPITTEMSVFLKNAGVLKTNSTLVQHSLNIVDNFERLHGGLFTPENTDSTSMFDSNNHVTRDGTQDGKHLARSMIQFQQQLMDTVFGGSLSSVCAKCLFGGRAWKTADFFPGNRYSVLDEVRGNVEASDITDVHTITIDATVIACWGIPYAFCKESARKPLGMWLQPGALGYVTVPSSMIDAGYEILVGANTQDHKRKSHHRRLDRVTLTFTIHQATTLIYNPLGGGVYISVPYRAALGLVEIEITGVIEAPLFRMLGFTETTSAEWDRLKVSPAPWADIQTKKFQLSIPSSYVFQFPYSNIKAILERWDIAMDTITKMYGFEPEQRNKENMYLQMDLQLRDGAHGVGYPQVNSLYQPNNPRFQNWETNVWYLHDPLSSSTEWHETGHVQIPSYFSGETEAANNFMLAHAKNTVDTPWNVSLEQAFEQSFRGDSDSYNFRPDEAAIHWMATYNFREGKEMDHSNTEQDQFRYQERGYCKYYDYVHLFGWEAFYEFHYNDNNDFNNGNSSDDGLTFTDSRVHRMSIAAGVDITPLIHFWGIHPEQPDALKQQMLGSGLAPSTKIRHHLLRLARKIISSFWNTWKLFSLAHHQEETLSTALDGTTFGKRCGTRCIHRKPTPP